MLSLSLFIIHIPHIIIVKCSNLSVILAEPSYLNSLNITVNIAEMSYLLQDLCCPLPHLSELNPRQGDQIHLRPAHPLSCQHSQLPTLVCSSPIRLTLMKYAIITTLISSCSR